MHLGTVTADIPSDLHHSEPTLEEAEKDRLSDPEILAMVLYTGAREDAESFEFQRRRFPAICPHQVLVFDLVLVFISSWISSLIFFQV